MKLKTIIILAAIILLLFVSMYFFLWYSYSRVLKKEKLDWYNETFIPSDYRGIVYDINKAYFTTIQIKSDSVNYTYGMCIENINDDFPHLIEVGDSVVKRHGDKELIFIKKGGSLKINYELPFSSCKDFTFGR